jgi:hypothetical protein
VVLVSCTKFRTVYSLILIYLKDKDLNFVHCNLMSFKAFCVNNRILNDFHKVSLNMLCVRNLLHRSCFDTLFLYCILTGQVKLTNTCAEFKTEVLDNKIM